ncbi:MAG: hypothetical protein NUW01_07075 [Gemmatimonadaceae bacterium]|nr:hypothetical protein [Gemmatimonadaceae bacterium]
MTAKLTDTVKLTDVADEPDTWEGRSASGQTVVTASVGPRGHVLVTVTRNGHSLERIDLGYEPNMGPHAIIKTDGKNLYMTQKESFAEAEVIPIV